MIAIGADHGGYELKEGIKKYLAEKGIKYEDAGTHNGDSVDYPDIAEKVCNLVTSGKCSLAILFCGTGIGISIAANKIKGIRCCACSETYSAKMSRIHNNANAIALGGRVIGIETAKELVDAFLSNEFEGGRHERRVGKITALENKF